MVSWMTAVGMTTTIPLGGACRKGTKSYVQLSEYRSLISSSCLCGRFKLHNVFVSVTNAISPQMGGRHLSFIFSPSFYLGFEPEVYV